MAKRKKSSNPLSKYGVYLLLVLSVAVAAMLFVNAVTYKPENGDPTSYVGRLVAFGGTIENASFSLGGYVSGTLKINFSILACIAYLLPIVGCIISMLLIKNKSIKGFIIAICFLASAILCFMMPQITNISYTRNILGNTSVTTNTFASLDYGLGIGSIIAGALSALGTLVGITYTVSK